MKLKCWLTLITIGCLNLQSYALAFETSSPEILLKQATGKWWPYPERSMTFLDVGDVNNDGYDDLLIGMNSFPEADKGWIHKSKPILLVFDPSTSQYQVDEAFRDAVPEQIWSRRGIIVDLNNDKHPEVFIAGAGSDGWGFAICGEQNILIQKTNGAWTDISSNLPQTSDFSHGLAYGDFDGNKTTDLLVLNSPYINSKDCLGNQDFSNRSYFWGFGTDGSTGELKIDVTKKNLNLNNSKSFEEIHSGLAALLDNDEKPDLVFGTNLGIYILENKGWGKYVRAASFSPPKAFLKIAKDIGCTQSSGQCNVPYSDIVGHDIDGDGKLEVIASLAFQQDNGTWAGQHFQVLKRQNNKWIDVTTKVFPEQNLGPFDGYEWCMSISMVDLNNDGFDDVVCNSATNLGLREGLELYFIFKDGKYLPLRSTSGLGELQTKLKSISEGHPILVGHANLNGVNNLVAIWQLWVNESGKGDTIKSIKVRTLPLN